jgi:ankyrin repeat protein
VVEYLLNSGADVHAKDKGGLVPLHNACSYGHYEVSCPFYVSSVPNSDRELFFLIQIQDRDGVLCLSIEMVANKEN